MSADRAPAELVRDLREHYGSHDKLAAALGTSRQRVIAWEKGRQIPSQSYADKLAALSGLTASEYRTGSTAAARQVEQRLATLVLAAETLADRLEALLDAPKNDQGGPLQPRHGR